MSIHPEDNSEQEDAVAHNLVAEQENDIESEQEVVIDQDLDSLTPPNVSPSNNLVDIPSHSPPASHTLTPLMKILTKIFTAILCLALPVNMVTL